MINGKVVIKLDKFAATKALSRTDASKAIRAAAQHGRNKVVQSIQERSPGEPQFRYDPDRWAVAANPGETPNTDTGNLVNSIQVEAQSDLQQAIIVGAVYGAALEFGTPNMAARPFMMPMAVALEQEAASFFEHFLAGL